MPVAYQELHNNSEKRVSKTLTTLKSVPAFVFTETSSFVNDIERPALS